MTTSEYGRRKIEGFEGCVLHAYKAVPTEPYYTIGYGHYGADVAADMTITAEEADSLFAQDLKVREQFVDAMGLELTQNQFDALVSFCYNCGTGSLQKLVAGRSILQIANAMLMWNKDNKGNILPGLVTRRQWEHDMMLKDVEPGNDCPYGEPQRDLFLKSRGNDVRWLQYMLNSRGNYGLLIDGIFGPKTHSAVIAWQQRARIKIDGIAGKETIGTLKKGGY